MTTTRPTHTTCRLCGQDVPTAAVGRIADCHKRCLRVIWAADRLARELAACVEGMPDLAAVSVRRQVAANTQAAINSATNGALARTRKRKD